MRQCTSCKTLFDNGIRFCDKCGEKFPYDPKVSPYSEGKMAVILILLVAIAILSYNTYVNSPITDTKCSRTNYLRLEKWLDNSRNEVMRIHDHGYIPIGGSSIVMRQKYAIEELTLPPCFEPIRADMIEYYTLMYRVTQISVFGGYAYTIPLLEQAYQAQERVEATMQEINKCIPNCPEFFSDVP